MIKRKSAFLLLEVLVAMSIVLLCILPLFIVHARLYQDEVAVYEQVQLERWADLSFFEVCELLQNDPKNIQKTKNLSK